MEEMVGRKGRTGKAPQWTGEGMCAGLRTGSLRWKGESLESVPGAVSTGSVDRAMASGR